MKTDQIVMLAALGAAAFFLTRQAGAAPVARKNAAPLIWAQNPTAANPQSNTAAQKLNLLGAGLGLVSSLFGNTQSSTSSYVPTYQNLVPDYGFDTAMLGTASSAAQADQYAMNAPASYYGLGFDTSESATGSGWWN